ncbi:MAG: hypothetical protein P4M05_28205 [Bradyrhizobium sp.]|nr:hypothetical protein [Bradyrhizobium sp.]
MKKHLDEIRWRVATFFRYRLPSARKRWLAGLAYARGRLTEAQALQLLWECQQVAGTHCLISIDAKDVEKAARERWGDHPDLSRLSRDATTRIATKWSDTGETRGAAEDWALDLVAEYAAGEGIDLVEIEETEAAS